MSIRSFVRTLIAVVCMATILLSGCSASDVPAASEPVPTEAPYTVESVGGVDCYSVDGRVYAAELGAPILDKDTVIELFRAMDMDAAAEKIANIGDAFSYLKLKPKSINGPKEACSFVADMISGDYNSIGFIEFDYTDDHNIGDHYSLLYVEHEGIYYALDVYGRGSDWITDPKNDCFSNTDKSKAKKCSLQNGSVDVHKVGDCLHVIVVISEGNIRNPASGFGHHKQLEDFVQKVLIFAKHYNFFTHKKTSSLLKICELGMRSSKSLRKSKKPRKHSVFKAFDGAGKRT